jgi:hypothetical protein
MVITWKGLQEYNKLITIRAGKINFIEEGFCS